MNHKQRQFFPDEIRGLALLGIIWVNAPYMALSATGFDRALNSSWVDQATEFVVAAVFQTKFYLLFSFLFGYSAHLILCRAGKTPAFGMRLLGLAILGLAHAALFFVGDILLTYALLGTVLLFAQHWRDKTLLTAGTLSAVTAIAWLVLIALAAASDPASMNTDNILYVAFNEAAAGSSFARLLEARVALLPSVLGVIGSLQWGFALACFFLGLLAGRHALLSNPEQHAALWKTCRQLAWVGFPLTIAGAWLIAGPGSSGAASLRPRELYGTLLVAGIAPLVTASYVGFLVALRARFPNVLSAFRPVGRMSLTTYLAESVLLCVVFCGWGLGWFAEFSNVAVISTAVALYLALALAAKIWLDHFEQGPMEWLMKQWTQLGSDAK
jgi:uncharacterized protein